MTSGASSASCAAAACSRWSRGGRGDQRRRAGWHQVAPSQCFTDSRCIRQRQRHGAPSSRPGRTLKGACALAVSHNVRRQHFRTAPEQAWPRLRAEREGGPSAYGGRVREARQVVEESLRPQPMQIDPDELSAKLPARSDGHLGARRADRRRIIVGVGEGSHSARRHLEPRQRVSTQCAKGSRVEVSSYCLHEPFICQRVSAIPRCIRRRRA